MTTMQGLARAREILRDRPAAARKEQREGRLVLGYLSVHVPLELLTGLGMTPFRVFGDIREPVSEADRGLPSAFCPYLRSVLDLALKGRFAFLDGLVASHSCDAQEKTVRVLPSLVAFPFSHYLDVPATTGPAALSYFRSEVAALKAGLEELGGRELTEAALRDAIHRHNEQRGLVRALYEANRANPPAATGREALEVTTALQTLPVDEGNRLLREVLAEVSARGGSPGRARPRLLLWGGVLHDPAYLEAIEASGADVVVDDLDEGRKPYATDVADVADGGDLFGQLAHRYLVGVPAARTFRGAGAGPGLRDRAADLEARFGYLGDLAERWRVDGAILQAPRYCDPHACDVVDLADYLRSRGVPSLYVEHDYREGSLAPFRTRVEAFVETLG